MAATGGPANVVGLALIGHGGPIPVGGQRRADATARFADDRDGQPARRALHLADPEVHVADRLGAVEGAPDEGIHRAVAVQLAHPVDLRPDAEPREGAHEELAHEVARVGCGRAPGWSRNVRQRHAHVAFHRIGREQGLGVHGVEVVDPVEEAARAPSRRCGPASCSEKSPTASGPNGPRISTPTSDPSSKPRAAAPSASSTPFAQP